MENLEAIVRSILPPEHRLQKELTVRPLSEELLNELRKILATLTDIELTKDEEMIAIIHAKQRKKKAIQERENRRLADENRRHFICTDWDYETTLAFMEKRAASIFDPDTPFVIDDNNIDVFKLLCLYFSNDERFVRFAKKMGVLHPSLEKGIILQGPVGVGKTSMMRVFGRNKRQCFSILDADDLADEYEKQGAAAIEPYKSIRYAAHQDSSVFFQPTIGLCVDDIGKEEEKTHFGNHADVIAKIIQARYKNNAMGRMFHATTNRSFDQLGEFYGDRVQDRLLETLNFIELPGESRRK